MLAHRVIARLIKDEVIAKEQKDIYFYGIQILLIISINILSYLFWGIALNMFVELCVFLIGYISLRSYVGGLHLKSAITCFFVSNVVIGIALLLIELIQKNRTFNFIGIAGGISTAIIGCAGVMENKNKKKTAEEMRKLKKQAHIVLYIINGMSIIAWLRQITSIFVSLQLSIITVAVLMICQIVVFKYNCLRSEVRETV